MCKAATRIQSPVCEGGAEAEEEEKEEEEFKTTINILRESRSCGGEG